MEMAQAQIEITLRGDESDGGLNLYEPRGVFQGSVQIITDSDVDCRHLYARLLWHTEGRGDSDRGVVDELDLFQGQLTAGSPTYHTFHFTLPQEPWSYAGYYINIIWEVEVVVDVPWRRDLKAQEQFILAPRQS